MDLLSVKGIGEVAGRNSVTPQSRLHNLSGEIHVRASAHRNVKLSKVGLNGFEWVVLLLGRERSFSNQSMRLTRNKNDKTVYLINKA